jgi:predicted RNase H-like nuclease (RuvC/YqgF family)
MTSEWEQERQRLIHATKVKTVSIHVLEDWYEQLVAYARERGWSEEETLRLALIDGLSYFKGELALRKVERADTSAKVLEEFHETTQEMMNASSRAAVLKFQAYQLSHDNQVMDMREAALKNELRMSRNRIAMFREDEEKLKAKIHQLEQENLRLRAQLTEPVQQARHEAKRRGFLRLFGR